MSKHGYDVAWKDKLKLIHYDDGNMYIRIEVGTDVWGQRQFRNDPEGRRRHVERTYADLLDAVKKLKTIYDDLGPHSAYTVGKPMPLFECPHCHCEFPQKNIDEWHRKREESPSPLSEDIGFWYCCEGLMEDLGFVFDDDGNILPHPDMAYPDATSGGEGGG